jgi:hypothetical protein
MGVIGGLIFAIVGAAIGALFGAVFLRAGIWLYNKMAGPTYSVAEPTFGRAIVISFMALLVNFIVEVLFDIVLINGSAAGTDQRTRDLLDLLVGIPISMTVTAAMLSKMLPTTFGRGFLIAICQMLIALAVAMVLMAIVFVVMGATR